MITLEGTLTRLAPGFQIIEETRKIAASWLGEVLGPASLRDAATDEALGLLPVLRRLPRRLDRITTSLERGTLTTSTRLLADDRDRHFVASMAGRAVLAFLGAAFGIISVMLTGVRGGPLLTPAAAGTGGTSLFHAFGYAGLFFGLVLMADIGGYFDRPGGYSRRAPEPRLDCLPSRTDSRTVSFRRECRSVVAAVDPAAR